LFVTLYDSLVIAKAGNLKLTYDPMEDLIPVALIGDVESVFLVRSSSPYKTMPQFLAEAKAKGGKMSFGTIGVGSTFHLTMEQLNEQTSAGMLHVPYKGGAPAVTDTVAGHVDGIVMDIPPLMSMIKDGRLKALAVTSEKRVDFLPSIPTAQEFLPNFNVVNWLGIFAPAQTPAPIVAKINAAILTVIARTDVRQKLEAAAIIPSSMESPATFQAFVNTEYSRWGEVLKQAKVELTD
jgi:tripartite-type tricarboxylate transporter receptor subunit TctC